MQFSLESKFDFLFLFCYNCYYYIFKEVFTVIKRKRRNIEDEISFFESGLSSLANTPVGLHYPQKVIENPFRHLKKMVKRRLHKYGLQFSTIPKKAKYMVIIYAEFDNSDGYDCLGFNCYKKSFWGKFPEIDSITYCGVCGDVNRIHLTQDNSKVLYLSAV